MGADLVSLVEAAYFREDDLSSWLENLVRMADATISGGKGVFGIVVESESRRGSETTDHFTHRTNVLAASHSGLPDGTLAAAGPLLEFAPTEMVRRRYVSAGPVGTLSGVFADVGGEFEKGLKATGFRDALYLRAADARGVELVLSIPDKQPIRIASARKLLLSHVASHIKTAYRLRQRGCKSVGEDDGVEAIFSSAGKVEHAAGPALRRDSRMVLRAAALACLRAKTRGRKTDEASALDAWKALFCGRWSVIDHFDTDGKRFIVAHRNEPDSPQAKGLTSRESLVATLAAQGYANKEMHYELGWPLSTIASSLTSAMLKLGVSSRTELIRILAAAGRA